MVKNLPGRPVPVEIVPYLVDNLMAMRFLEKFNYAAFSS
jgi:hypothetical protein